MNDQIETKIPKSEKEVWVKIKGSEIYEISNLCRVRTIKMHTYVNIAKMAKGYRSVSLRNVHGKRSESCYLHRLMADAFLPNPENKKCVNHKNGNKTDNSIHNLEWATHKENSIHAHATGLNDVPRLKGVNHPMVKFCENDVIDVLKMGLICGISTKRIAKLFEMDKSTISYILSGKLWKEQHENFISIHF